MVRWQQTALKITLSLLATTSTLTAAASLTALAYEGRVLPQTMVAGLPIGGLPYSQAYQLLHQTSHQLSSATITLVFDNQEHTLSLKQLGVTVDAQETKQAISRPPDRWEWLRLRYWQAFFQPKHLAYDLRVNTPEMEHRIREAFGITANPTDARLVVESGQLKVIPSRNGQSVDLKPLVHALEHTVKTGQLPPPLTLAATEFPAALETAVANRTKTEITSALKPVNLQSGAARFTIPVEDQYDFLLFEPHQGQLQWSVSKEKLQTYLDRKVARRLFVRMTQKTVMADTQEVTSEGRNGQEVELAALTDQVHQSIVQRLDTAASPISIPIKTIAFTEKIIYPDYVAGLFPGLYLDISLAKQTLYIMNGTEKLGSYPISSGRRGTPTPRGIFYIKNKIDLARSRLYSGLWMPKWNALARNPDGSGYEGYGIHALPCFDPNCRYVEGSAHLGRPVSRGCIRLSAEAAQLVYDTIPIGTPVNIH